MDDRFNTIAGWVLFAGIVALGSSIVAGEMFHSERPEKMGYPIAGVAQEGEGAAAAEQPIEVYLAKADPAKGQQVFNKCMACHNADKGGANQLGPNLWDVIGEPIGQGKGFAFSDALAKKGGTWNWDNLSQWLISPKAFAPGTKMTFAGLSNPAGPRQRHRLPEFAQRCAQAASSGAGRDGRRVRRQAGQRAGQRPAEGGEGAGSGRPAGTGPQTTGGEAGARRALSASFRRARLHRRRRCGWSA